MTKDWRQTLTIDSELASRGIEVDAVRFVSGDEPDIDLEYHLDLAVALRKESKRWPRGDYWLSLYDDQGTLIKHVPLDLIKTLDKTVRQILASTYAPEFESAELVFMWEGDGGTEWDKLVFDADADSLAQFGLKVHGASAESHPDFEFSNLTIVQFRGRVVGVGDLPLPTGVWAEVTVLDGVGDVLGTKQIDLSAGPTAGRSFDSTIQVYRHQIPELVRLELFTV